MSLSHIPFLRSVSFSLVHTHGEENQVPPFEGRGIKEFARIYKAPEGRIVLLVVGKVGMDRSIRSADTGTFHTLPL